MALFEYDNIPLERGVDFYLEAEDRRAAERRRTARLRAELEASRGRQADPVPAQRLNGEELFDLFCGGQVSTAEIAGMDQETVTQQIADLRAEEPDNLNMGNDTIACAILCYADEAEDVIEAAQRERGFADANQRDFWTRVGDQALPFLRFVTGCKIQLSEWEWLWNAYCHAQDAKDEANTQADATH